MISLLKVVSNFYQREYSEMFVLIARGCVFRDEQIHTDTLTHTHYSFSFVKIKSLNMQSIFLMFQPAILFHFFLNSAVQ